MEIVIFSLIVLFFSVVIHEIAHGSVALYLGDTTARDAGRLTLNPIKHIDFFGSILLPLLLLVATMGQGPIFGWAKPVPINPYNLRDKKWGALKVAIAGPASNFILALFFGLMIRFVHLPPAFLMLFGIIVFYNFMWGIFNLIPIPPLDGSHILFSFLPERFDAVKLFLMQYGFFILIFFIFFGLNIVGLAASFLFSIVAGRGI